MVPVFVGEVARVQGNAEVSRHGSRVARVLLCRAGAVTIILLPVLHEHAGDPVFRTLQQQGSNR